MKIFNQRKQAIKEMILLAVLIVIVCVPWFIGLKVIMMWLWRILTSLL